MGEGLDSIFITGGLAAEHMGDDVEAPDPVLLEDWRGDEASEAESTLRDYDAEHYLIKEEVMPDGSVKLILKEKATGKVIQKVTP